MSDKLVVQLTYMGNQIKLHYTSIHLVNEILDSLWVLVPAEFEIQLPIKNYQHRATPKTKIAIGSPTNALLIKHSNYPATHFFL